MTPLAVLRHARTDWNDDGRLQGRADIPLNAAGRHDLARWRLPEPFASTPRWVTSPLRRAVETAEVLRPADSTLSRDDRLLEMSFGDWEGRRLADLRRKLGSAFAENEARGLDFQPPGGESPRSVRDRLRPFLEDAALCETPMVAVAHKAVIRALISIGTGWDMTNDPPVKVRPATVFLMRLEPDGSISGIETMSLVAGERTP